MTQSKGAMMDTGEAVGQQWSESIVRRDATIAAQAAELDRLRQELAQVLDVTIARGTESGYDDIEYCKRYRELTGRGWDESC